MKTVASLLVVGTLAGCITGCGSNPKTIAKEDPVLSVLADVANQISMETTLIKEIIQDQDVDGYAPDLSDPTLIKEIIQDQDVDGYAPDLSDPTLNRPMTVIDYAGTADKILAHISKTIDYEFITSHNNQNFQHTVIISASDTPVVNIIRDIAAQLGKNVRVTLSIKHRQIRVEYL